MTICSVVCVMVRFRRAAFVLPLPRWIIPSASDLLIEIIPLPGVLRVSPQHGSRAAEDASLTKKRERGLTSGDCRLSIGGTVGELLV